MKQGQNRVLLQGAAEIFFKGILSKKLNGWETGRNYFVEHALSYNENFTIFPLSRNLYQNINRGV